MTRTLTAEGVRAQDSYISQLEATGFGYDLAVGDAFIRGMRDIGYKSTSFALAEIIDNAVQAGATKIEVIFGPDERGVPTSIAVVDNGHGMRPKMTRLSLIWGAGTRGNNTNGFGKYGYGLPSASVSQCHRVTVHSKIVEGDWFASYLDIDEIRDGRWTDGNRISMPPEEQSDPPSFILDYLAASGRWDDFPQGTVVTWEHLDRVAPKRRDGLRNRLLTDFGVIYRNYLTDTPMWVDGVEVQPCDPLFLTEGYRYYDLDDDRAIEYPSDAIEVRDKDGDVLIGTMRLRFARMPATFFRVPEAKHTNKPGPGQTNERLEIADANNGIIFLRSGRQIDVVRPPRWLMSINATTDRFWAIEVDFDPTLDDEFAITTSKQQVVPSDRIWNMLRDKGNLKAAIAGMRTAYEKEAKALASQVETRSQEKRASVEAIERAKKFQTQKPPKETPDRTREAEANLEREARRRADKAGLDPKRVEQELIAQQAGNPFRVALEDLPGAPFYRTEQQGMQRVLFLNVAHRFYTDLYAGEESTPRLRAALEVMLWALAEAELDADVASDRRLFYERERASVWSPYVNDALTQLSTIALVTDTTTDTSIESESPTPPPADATDAA
jgi:hypothetical protein